MTTEEYKQSLRDIVDSTNNEALLKHWKTQLEYDLKHQDELELNNEEWNLVQEGVEEYTNGEYISLEEFISNRK